MPNSLSTVVVSRLEKAAFDNGFDRQLASLGNWLEFASTQCSLRIWLGSVSTGLYAAAFSKSNVGNSLVSFGPTSSEAPPGAASSRVVSDIPALHQLLRRAFQLGKSLPDELLHVFEAQTASLPRSTEAERLIIQRVGQDIFRQGLLEYWEGRCAITGLDVPELLRSSHIKRWAASTDAERLDVFNGLLLAPHLDAAFDQGFITIDVAGAIIVSAALSNAARRILNVSDLGGLSVPVTGHRAYLVWHRERIFKD